MSNDGKQANIPEDKLMTLEEFPPSRIRNFSIIAHIGNGSRIMGFCEQK